MTLASIKINPNDDLVHAIRINYSYGLPNNIGEGGMRELNANIFGSPVGHGFSCLVEHVCNSLGATSLKILKAYPNSTPLISTGRNTHAISFKAAALNRLSYLDIVYYSSYKERSDIFKDYLVNLNTNIPNIFKAAHCDIIKKKNSNQNKKIPFELKDIDEIVNAINTSGFFVAKH